MEQNRLNEAELLAHVCRVLEKNDGVFEQAMQRNEHALQVDGMTVDFDARRIQVEGLNVDFEAGNVQAWEKNLYLSRTEFERLSELANQLGVTVDPRGFLARVSGDGLEIPIILYISPSAE